jgi:antitoxin MazE
MITKIQKWGNSLAVRIPKTIAEDTHLSYGNSVDLAVSEGRIIIAPSKKQRFKLNDLLRGITPENKHEEIECGNAVGREAL